MTTEFKLHEMLIKDCIEIFEFPLCKVLLMNDRQYPWFILVPKVNDILDVYELEWEQQTQALNESSLLSEVLMGIYKGKKMNTGALGNLCPQLHIHHIVRFENDIAWPKPIWGAFPAIPYTEEEIQQVKDKVCSALSKTTT